MSGLLDELDQRSATLQKDGDYIGALEAVEEALRKRKELYGVDSEQVAKTCERLCELCNLMAIQYLERQDYALSLDLLKRAELLSEKSVKSKAATYNNFACYFRRIGKLKTAVQFLDRALALQSESADTHLNMCAVRSQMGKHSVAAEHAMQAIILLQEQTIERLTNSSTEEDRSSVLAIAFHNLAVEFEFMKRVPEALMYYGKALGFARSHLPQDHKLIKDLEGILETATNQHAKGKGRVPGEVLDKLINP